MHLIFWLHATSDSFSHRTENTESQFAPCKALAIRKRDTVCEIKRQSGGMQDQVKIMQ